VNVEEIQEKKDEIIAKIDNPASWLSFARVMNYDAWKLEMMDNYFIISMTIKVTDVYTY
jgi:hypothetical protein